MLLAANFRRENEPVGLVQQVNVWHYSKMQASIHARTGKRTSEYVCLSVCLSAG